MVSFILSGEAMGEAMGSNSILVKKCEFFVSFFFLWVKILVLIILYSYTKALVKRYNVTLF